jgi:hypothetical protein
MALTLDLPPDLKTKLEAEAKKRGISAPEYLRKIVEDLFAHDETSGESKQEFAHPILKLAEEARKGIPPEELAKLPPDLSKNLDHYLYGHPKVKE